MRRKGLRFLLAACACLAATPAVAQVEYDGDTESLKEALAKAYANNPTLQAARANLRVTDEGVPLERADALPSLSASPNISQTVYDSSGPGPDWQAGIGVNLSVPVYAGGGVKAGIRAAETRVLAGRADLRGTESDVFSRVVAAYMDVIQQEAIVALAASNVDVLTTNLEATSDRFQIGDLTRTDVAQSEARLALARGELRTAQSNLVRVRENFVALVGDAPDEDLQPPPPLPGLPDDPETAVDVALENNPDLIAALERAQAAGFDIRVASASRLPRVDVTTSGNYSTFLGSIPSSSAGFLDNSSSGVTAGVRATVPLFQGGRPAALERQAQARQSVALENVVFTERDIIAQVRSAFSSWRASTAIIASSQAAVQAAELSLEGVRAEQTVGNRTILDMLDAQQEVLRAQLQLITARRNEYVAGFALLAAMGRAEARDLGLEEFGTLYDPELNYDRVSGIIWDWAKDRNPVTQSTRTVDIPAQDADIPEVQLAE